jgi:hypothetical protein
VFCPLRLGLLAAWRVGRVGRAEGEDFVDGENGPLLSEEIGLDLANLGRHTFTSGDGWAWGGWVWGGLVSGARVFHMLVVIVWTSLRKRVGN